MLKNISFFILILTANLIFASSPREYQSNHLDKEGRHTVLKETKFDPVPLIMDHISDAHDIHLWGHGHNAVSIPLPVILWTKNGFVTFMSSEFHHDNTGHHVVTKKGQSFVRNKNKIYYSSLNENKQGNFLTLNEKEEIQNTKPWDFSITKSVVGILLIMAILLLIFTSVARSYKKNGGIPKKLTGLVEPLVIFVRDEIAKPNINKGKHTKYVPFLLTIFFFIWFLNLLGLTPFGFNVTGNIAVTLVLAVISLLVILISANKNYWSHIFNPPVPLLLKPLMIPIEIIGIFTKPFALMVRLFANISAGHIVILSLISLIFIAQHASGTGLAWAISPGSLFLVLFIFILEILVAILQAYIFTLLTALFIGMAVEEHHH